MGGMNLGCGIGGNGGGTLNGSRNRCSSRNSSKITSGSSVNWMSAADWWIRGVKGMSQHSPNINNHPIMKPVGKPFI
jgi:hypothetical protein